jgi:hypothetical protein
MTPSKGVALFAYDTDKIKYSKLAMLAAGFVKKAMTNNNVCLITDQPTWDNMCGIYSTEAIDAVFDEVVIAEVPKTSNSRIHRDSPWSSFTNEFRNRNKHLIIDYTPYDQTLLIDIDYIMQNNYFDYLFDTDQSVAMYHNAHNLIGKAAAPDDTWLNPAGIPMLWSTVIYFDKHSDDARQFFDMWAFVGENYDFYRMLYGFYGSLFRTDYCVSIASHILNGMRSGSFVNNFSDGAMINMSQCDDIAAVHSWNDWTYLSNNRDMEWNDNLVRIKSENVHVMNKMALLRSYDELMGELHG